MRVHSSRAAGRSQTEDGLARVYDSVLVRRLLAYLRPYHRPLLGALALMPVVSGLRLLQPVLLMAAIDGPVVARDPSGLAGLALVFLGTMIAELLAQFGHFYLVQLAGQHAMRDLRAEVFAHVQDQSVAWLQRTPVGRLVTRVTTDIESLNEMFAMGVVQVVGDFVTLTLILVALPLADKLGADHVGIELLPQFQAARPVAGLVVEPAHVGVVHRCVLPPRPCPGDCAGAWVCRDLYRCRPAAGAGD